MMKNKKFVFDVNVIISSFLFKASKPRQALEQAQDIGVIIVSHAILSELTEVLFRDKFNRYLTLERRQELLKSLRKTSVLIEPNKRINICRDEKDNKYLELAVSGQVEYLITGDTDLLVLNPFRDIVIITPAEFLERS